MWASRMSFRKEPATGFLLAVISRYDFTREASAWSNASTSSCPWAATEVDPKV